MHLKNKLFWLLPIVGVLSFWSFATPIFEFPDEQAHVESVEFLRDNHRKPGLKEFDMTNEMFETQNYLGTFRDERGNNKVTYHPEYHPLYSNSLTGRYETEIGALNNDIDRTTYVAKEAADYPRLYYDYVGAISSFVQGSSIFTRVYVMRIASLILAIATAVVVYGIGLTVFSSIPRARTLTTLVMLQPMYSFLSAGVNSDNLHNLLFAMIIWLGLQVVKSGMNQKIFLTSILVIILDMMTKPQGYIAVLILLSAYLIKILTDKKWKQLFFILICSIAFISLVFSTYNPYLDWVNKANLHNANFAEFLRFSISKLVTQNIVWYWGVFKWLGVVLPPMYWQVANRIILISGLGLVVYLWRVIKKKKLVTNPGLVIFLAVATITYISAIYYFDWQYHKAVGYSLGVQARYFFPTISAQMALLMVGILSLGPTKNIRTLLRKGLIIFIVWIQLGGIWRLLGSYYDLTDINNFIIQISQYKPDFLKGDWWWFWIAIYFGSIFAILVKGLRSINPLSAKKPRATKVVSKNTTK